MKRRGHNKPRAAIGEQGRGTRINKRKMRHMNVKFTH